MVMKANRGILLGVVFLVGSCNNESKTSSAINKGSSDSLKMITADTISSGCFSQVVQKDTALLQVENNKGNITGALTYNYFQKDRNDGTLKGDQTGEIINGWYLFKSEGIMSVRQVSWKINGNELWPAIGEVVEKNDTTLFKEPEKLRYDSTHPFRKIPCII
jgi:hypothetical protein